MRRMMAARGMPVTYLKRVAFGGLTLGELPLGAVKEVSWKRYRARLVILHKQEVAAFSRRDFPAFSANDEKLEK